MARSSDESIQDKAYRLLKAIKARTENSHQPIFVAELALELKMSEAEVQGAFRYPMSAKSFRFSSIAIG